jgi:hypothetical protein
VVSHIKGRKLIGDVLKKGSEEKKWTKEKETKEK